MKRKLSLLMAFVLITSLALVGCGDKNKTSSNGVTKLSFSTAANENSTWHQGALKFAELVEEGTDGKYKIDIYTMDQLSGGNQATGIELVQTGSTDIHLTDALVWSSIQPKAIVPAMPWLLPTYDDVDKHMLGEGGQAVMDALSESGVQPLAIGESGYRQVVNTKRPIRSPKDMVGLKMRIPGSNTHVSLLKHLGADPITMSSTEVYTSTQQGTIDASENTIDLLLSQKTLEVSKYLTMWNYSYDPIFLVVSQNLWSKLNDDEKLVFENAAKEAMELQKQLVREEANNALTIIREEYPNVEIVEELTKDELNAFKEASRPVYDEVKATLGEEIFEKFGYEFK